ncbi:non-hydrolyzing UDP-N-acetylglucosamine 2-epimerase [Streptomyces sp. NPDC059070]|uniref:non-hydrolyzing UDP-N-acetylglucosamine 2-epimerase n=1 Tax=unclassified Streptomyces TaxID=2593676 RepID=UPI0034E1D2E6
MRRRVAVVIGTRPEAIKMAPVIQELAADGRFDPLVVSTGQHTDMLDQVLDEFGIAPDVDLAVRRGGQTLAELTGAVISGLDAVFERAAPHAVLAHGDTTTALGAGLAAFYRAIPLAHVEAGLRSADKWAPYPEEVNRRTLALLADLHLAPTARARQNLLAEGVRADAVVVTGNTVVDAMHGMVRRARGWADPALAVLDQDPRRVLLFTCHRREAWGPAMEGVARAVRDAADRHPDMLVVAGVHANPVVRAALLPALGRRDNVVLTGPQPYSTFLKLIQRAHLVLTDSGGIQEECVGLGTPALVLREVTERQEAVAAGGIEVVGTDPARIHRAVDALWSDAARHGAMASADNPYGDGRAAGRCVRALARLLESHTARTAGPAPLPEGVLR